jgi:hypothetical protein
LSKEIHLTQGQTAVVDDADFDSLASFRWRAFRRRDKFYAVRTGGWGNVMVLMHRQILDAAPGQAVDHKNGNGLDNRRCNIRISTRCGNQQNVAKRPGLSSKYKGVCRRPSGKWEASIYDGPVNRRGHAAARYLGRFDVELDAAMAYDAAARTSFGEFARLNFPDGLL